MQGLLSEEWLRGAVGMLVRLVEAAGALIIFAGAVVGFVRFWIAAAKRRGPHGFSSVRLNLGRFLALGLEFQLASDLLRTAVAPSFEQIGKLAAVAAPQLFSRPRAQGGARADQGRASVMHDVLDAGALALAGSGVVVLALSLSLTSRWRAGVPVTVELWTAAGLLRLAGEPDWSRIATAAAIVAARRLILSRRAIPP